jgi:hypothetical protein
MQRIAADLLVSENNTCAFDAVVLPKLEFEETYMFLENLCKALVRSTDAGCELCRMHVVKGGT